MLRGITKVEERENPVPWVVYEAIYTPQPDPRYPQFTPADVRVRLGAQARYEIALQKHINAQQNVTCHAAMTQGTCSPQPASADVAEFDPNQEAGPAAPHTTGCAAIETTSEQDRLRQNPNASVVGFPERFLFDADSSTMGADASTLASAVAKRMAADPGIECVGVIGQIGNGESATLAEARARGVKALLVSLGVDKSRLTTIALTTHVYGPASNPQPTSSSDRRVSLSVLLKSGAAAKQ
ncbi:MAG: hypothetical protein ABI488_11385 [Polyangiaceae bacterium]